MEFRVLGPLEVRGSEGVVALGGRKQRALLALFVLEANRVVARERLIDGLWSDDPPGSAVKLVQLYVSQLRKVLPAGVLVTRAPGYMLEVAPEAVDLARFERLVAEGQGVAPERASVLLGEALGLWRGPALAEFTEEPFFRVEGARLEELRLAALEGRFDAELALGKGAELVAELEAAVERWPLRERLRGQLMLAFFRSGRQTEALEAYRAGRAELAELGLEPGSRLRELERQILSHDPALEPEQGSALLPGRVVVPGPLLPEPAFPFVGRASELALLRERLARAQAGEGGLVLVGAEAGGGKTRLIREFAHQAASSGVLVLYGASDAAVTTPYQPLREWLEFLLRVSDRGALADCLGAGSEELARLVPELERLTGVSASGDRRDPENERFVLQASVIDLLTRLGRHQPLLAVVDDLHWADGETLHLLRRLARGAPEARWLVVAAYRSDEGGGDLAGTLAELGRLEGTARLALRSLDHGEVGAFVRASAEAEASEELVSVIWELTDGTPLLLCELWRELQESGGLEVTPTVRLTRPVADLRGRGRVRELVDQRLARLGPEIGALLELAAVVGPVFELGLIDAAAAGAGSESFADLLEEATAGGMIDELPGPAVAYRFTHELIRRAVYDRLSRARRAQLHLQVGEALERVHASDIDRFLAELAHHFGLAAPVAGPGRGIGYELRAADHVLLSSAALMEAAAHLERALELGIADDQLRTRVQIDLGWLLADAGRSERAAAVLREALASATELDEPGLAAYAAVFLARWDWVGLPRRPIGEMQATALDAIATFERIGDRRGLAVARHLLGYTYRIIGRGKAACAEFERALAEAEASRLPAIRRLVIAMLLQALQQGPTPVEEAITRCEKLRDSARGDAVLEATIERHLALLLAMATRFEDAREIDRRASTLLDQLDDQYSVFGRMFSAQTQRLLGNPAAAEQHYLAVWRRFGVAHDGAPRMQSSVAARGLADLYRGEGRWSEALDWLRRSVSHHEAALTTYSRPALTARLAAHNVGIDEDLARASHASLERILTALCPEQERSDQTTEFRDWRVQLQQALTATEQHSDFLTWRASYWLALAEIEQADGQQAAAQAATAAARALYERKGNLAEASALREQKDTSPRPR